MSGVVQTYFTHVYVVDGRDESDIEQTGVPGPGTNVRIGIYRSNRLKDLIPDLRSKGYRVATSVLAKHQGFPTGVFVLCSGTTEQELMEFADEVAVACGFRRPYTGWKVIQAAGAD